MKRQPALAPEEAPRKPVHGKRPRKSRKLPEWFSVLAAVGLMVGLTAVAVVVVMTMIRSSGDKADQAEFDRAIKKLEQAEVGDREIAALAENLPGLVDFYNAFPDEQTKLSEVRSQVIAGLLQRLPEQTDLAPLAKFKPESAPYAAAVDLLAERSSVEQRIALSCSSDEPLRWFAARALRSSFPLGQIGDDVIADLAAILSPSEKQQKFSGHYDRAHLEIERRLVGKYLLRIEAGWRTGDETEEQHASTVRQILSNGPRLSVNCAEKRWTIDFFGKSWTGGVEELVAVEIMAPWASAGDEFAGLPHVDQLQGAEVVFRLADLTPSVDISPSNRFVPEQSGDYFEGGTEGPSGVAPPLWAELSVEETIVNGELISKRTHWTTRAVAGFDPLVIDLLPAGT